MAACTITTPTPPPTASPASQTTTAASPTGAPKKDVELTLVSFAVTKQAHENIIPKFVEKWQKEQNQKVTFKQSYGGSSSQTRAVIDGLEAKDLGGWDAINKKFIADGAAFDQIQAKIKR